MFVISSQYYHHASQHTTEQSSSSVIWNERTSLVTPVLGASSFQSVSMLKSHHFVRSAAVFPAQVEVATALEEVEVDLMELEEEDDLEVLLEL